MRAISISQISEDRRLQFWSRVEKLATECGCWIWMGGMGDKGYGVFSVNGRNRLAHRVAFAIQNGEIGNELMVLHRCDTRICVNPAHLFKGVALDNTRDMIEKGREARGEKRSNAILNVEKAVAIRRRYANGENAGDLAAEFGVNRGTLLDLCAHRTWRHIPSEKGLPRRPFSKLLPEQVVEIRRRIATGEKQRQIARSMKLSETTISEIKSRRTWK